jgi:hypothetical protein
MTIQQTDTLAKSIAQRGKEIYETIVRPQVGEYHGRIAAIEQPLSHWRSLPWESSIRSKCVGKASLNGNRLNGNCGGRKGD